MARTSCTLALLIIFPGALAFAPATGRPLVRFSSPRKAATLVETPKEKSVAQEDAWIDKLDYKGFGAEVTKSGRRF